MTPFMIMAVQATLTMAITAFIAHEYLLPKLDRLPLGARLTPLLLVHAFRFVPLMLLQPGQVSDAFPPDLARLIAYGDLVAGLLAFAAVLAWRIGRFGLPMTWLFSIVGTADMLIVLTAALRAQVWQLPLGAIYVIPVFYVPVLIVFQVVIFVWLLKPQARS